MRTALPMPKYASVARRAAFYDRVLAGVRALPGVTDAALPTSCRWCGAEASAGCHRRPAQSAAAAFGEPALRDARLLCDARHPAAQGRDVDETDTADRPFVAVVSGSFVRASGPTATRWAATSRSPSTTARWSAWSATSRCAAWSGPASRRSTSPTGRCRRRLSSSCPRTWWSARGRADRPLPALRRIIRAADPEQPVSTCGRWRIVADETASRAVQVRVIGAFAAIAFLLAGIGIHGLLSFAVSQRAHEIGVRMALGAGTDDILAMVLRRAALLTAARVLPGAAARLRRGPGDGGAPRRRGARRRVDLPAAVVLCLPTTAAGSVGPALRALRVDPITVIRKE